MSTTSTQSQAEEQSLTQIIGRINDIYEDELGGHEIVLRNVGGDPYKYQLKVKPKTETMVQGINRFSDLGEEYTESELRAFLTALELSKIERISRIVEAES